MYLNLKYNNLKYNISDKTTIIYKTYYFNIKLRGKNEKILIY